jgi:catalase
LLSCLILSLSRHSRISLVNEFPSGRSSIQQSIANKLTPASVVHAKAAGAWGEFEVTHDISHITSANFLNKVGKKTKVLARLSTVAGSKGSSDTVRDIRGFALKMFTDEGNWDIVGNDLPVFFIRDPVKFPSLNRSHQAHPQTHVPDSSMFWDFHNNNQEVRTSFVGHS